MERLLLPRPGFGMESPIKHQRSVGPEQEFHQEDDQTLVER